MSLRTVRERSVVLSVLGFLLMTPPLLLVASHPEHFLGVPVLYVYVFVCWALLIAGNAWIAHSVSRLPDSAEEEIEGGLPERGGLAPAFEVSQRRGRPLLRRDGYPRPGLDEEGEPDAGLPARFDWRSRLNAADGSTGDAPRGAAGHGADEAADSAGEPAAGEETSAPPGGRRRD